MENSCSTKCFMKPHWGDWETWAEETDIGHKLVRYWVDGQNDNEECYFGFIRHLVALPNGKLMVGMATYDCNYDDNAYPSIEYYDWDKLTISWFASDSEEEGFE